MKIGCALIVVLTLVRVATTHRVFSATADEPVHIVAGQEWWLGDPAFDPLHPPLAKILFAIPWRNHARIDVPGQLARGLFLIYSEPDDIRNLARSRIPNLIFLAAAIVAVFAWAQRFGNGVALLAAAIFASTPAVLGHAGLATTDMAVAATVPIAVLAFERLLQRDRWRWRAAILFGLALGIGAISKFSFFVFFPVCAIVLMIVARAVPRIGHIVVAVLIATIVVWAAYRFTLAPFWNGLVMLKNYSAQGRTSFLLGRKSETGFWYYFPVVFFFKTPLPLLALAGAGAIAIQRARKGIEFVLMPLAMLLSAMPSHINIGVRHILPMYAPLCVVAAVGADALWRAARVGQTAALAMCVWLFVGVAAAHPDYLAWFNEAAGAHPERIAVDSNLDWGQDILRLARLTRRRHIPIIATYCASAMPFTRHGVPEVPLHPFERRQGWIAASETKLALDRNATPGGYVWLNAFPYERVGKSIRLYHMR